MLGQARDGGPQTGNSRMDLTGIPLSGILWVYNYKKGKGTWMKIKSLQARRERLLDQICGIGPVVRGSLAQVRLTCGKPRCRCRRGERHPALYFSYRSGGRSKVVHVPGAMLREVREAHRNWLRLKRLLERLADVQVALWKEVYRERKEAEKGTAARGRRR